MLAFLSILILFICPVPPIVSLSSISCSPAHTIIEQSLVQNDGLILQRKSLHPHPIIHVFVFVLVSYVLSSLSLFCCV